MLTAILLTVLYGAVWGVLWGGLDAIFILKGFMTSENQLLSILRSFLAMIIGSILTGLVFGAGSSLISVIVALVVAWYARPWVLARWRW